MKKLMQKICVGLILSFNILTSAVSADAPERVTVGGIPFGVKFSSEGIVVVGFTEVDTADGMQNPAYDAGLRTGDIITHVCGQPVKTSGEMIRLIESCPQPVEITYVREGDENTVSLTPSQSRIDGKMKTGMWIRDTTAGIGTVTFIEPETGVFAGLGHGICDSETGELLKMERGTVVDVQISGITKGVAGTPGELKGYFTGEKTGVLLGNTACGVYGVFTEIPAEVPMTDVELGSRWEVEAGEATILCTLDDNCTAEYGIEIDEIRRDSTDNRSFTIRVTDAELIEKTGGIVQGMSGSPILQNGRLVGAVTHVLVGDPCRGYGIFIENMLDAVE
ncbi:MAG: SpoIVB peptidase [Clostridia bacterium]|nr:SpoIVB peptidase [Clostridia bacterium]MBQ8512201.1 SpoIVB peptidase [Clostridia bacterium]